MEMTRDAALAELEAARAVFVGAYDGIPAEALSYLKPGDDYALGGLVTHVAAVLEHYLLVLSAVLDARFEEVRPEDPPGFWEHAGAASRKGLSPADAAAAFAEMEGRHREFVAAALALPEGDWERKAPVYYGTSEEALPTSPADISGWLLDHYREHVPQVAALYGEWRSG
jgi:hypothetical protein